MSKDFFGEELIDTSPSNPKIEPPVQQEFFKEEGNKDEDIVANETELATINVPTGKLNAREDMNTCLKLIRAGVLTKEQVQKLLR